MDFLSQIFETGTYWDAASFALYVAIGGVYALLINASVQPKGRGGLASAPFAFGAFLWFFFFLTFRDVTVGSDTSAYVHMFMNSKNVNIDWVDALWFKTHIEPLYLLLESAVRALTDNYTIFFAVKAVIISSSLTYFFVTFNDERQSCLPIMLIAIYFEFTAAIARSALGMSLLLLALCLERKNRRVLAVVLAVGACYFHNTLAVMFPLIVVLSFKWDTLRFTKRQLIVRVCFAIVLVNMIAGLLTGVVKESKYGYYYGLTTITILSLWNVFALAVILAINWKGISKNCGDKPGDRIMLLAFIYELACVPLVMAFGFWRMTTYFLPVRCVVWGIVLREWRQHPFFGKWYFFIAFVMTLGFFAACYFYLGRESLYAGFSYSFVF